MDNKYYEDVANQKGAAAAVVSVLKNRNLIAWHSALPAKSPIGYDDQIAPIVMWEFVCDESEANQVTALINSYQSKVGWYLEKLKSGRWRLMPTRAWRVLNENGDYIPIDAAADVKSSDPEYGVMANMEILDLAEYLDKKLDNF